MKNDWTKRSKNETMEINLITLNSTTGYFIQLYHGKKRLHAINSMQKYILWNFNSLLRNILTEFYFAMRLNFSAIISMNFYVSLHILCITFECIKQNMQWIACLDLSLNKIVHNKTVIYIFYRYFRYSCVSIVLMLGGQQKTHCTFIVLHSFSSKT